ncbi:unnamed protein product (macronuclear) [Paramecium tetraurelia]|uniref:Tetratricopeptide repeat protein n=1 Tax=Paramecium tetraurelia TaxID=5888 RepID=A0DIE8_PARTE|nr:uncharacterized protein GSPATT00017187001 [Paramecium tetraurelia]CAK82815.1 unnamed protein product [Paramecium tetraurelia]|eukprot:XP_001450212.1 hypothetical protein (macronuclear) [Paramecium tetraurelia strain d4-2]
MELEKIKLEGITNLIRQKLMQLELQGSDQKLPDVEKSRIEQDQRIVKLIEVKHKTIGQGSTYGDRSEWIKYHKTQGKQFDKKQQYEKALNEYYQSVLALNDSKLWRELGVSLIHNIQICLEFLKSPATKELLDFIIYVDKTNIKAYLKYGKFLSSNKKYTLAVQYFQQGEKLSVQMQDKEAQQDFQKQIQECRKQQSQNKN